MTTWKTAATAGAIAAAAVAGGTFTPAAHGQEREPIARTFEILGRDAQIGVSVHDAASNDKAGGVIVDDVRSGTPADKAGIKDGDAIVEFDGERVRSVNQFRRLVQETPDGHASATVVVRNGQRVTMTITPERGRGFYYNDFPALVPAAPIPPQPPRPPRPPLAPAAPGFEVFTWRSSDGRLGVTAEGLTEQLRDYFGVKNGVLVRSVREDSAAAKAGLKAGDVIVSMNGHHVDQPGDLADEIRGTDAEDFTLDVVRDHKAQALKGKLEARSTRWRSSERM